MLLEVSSPHPLAVARARGLRATAPDPNQESSGESMSKGVLPPKTKFELRKAIRWALWGPS